MGKIFDKTFKREILIGLIILLVSVIFQIGGWQFAKNDAKKNKIVERQIELTDRLSLQIEQFYYLFSYSSMQAFTNFAYEEDLLKPEDAEIRDANKIYRVSPRQALIMSDSLRAKYPNIYQKVIETNQKLSEIIATLKQVEVHFEDEQIRLISQNIRMFLSTDDDFISFLENRVRNRVSGAITNSEMQEFILNSQEKLRNNVDRLLRRMIQEYSN